METIQSLLLSNLVKNVNPERVQEMIIQFFTGMDAMRIALYLNGTIEMPEKNKILNTISGDAAKTITCNGDQYKEVQLKGVNYDFWRDELRFRAVFQEAYYFKSQEEAEKYEETGDHSNGYSWKNATHTFVGWHQREETGTCLWEQWQAALSE